MSKKSTLKVTLIKSMSNSQHFQKACVKGLGLRRIGQTIEIHDDACIRGMINKVIHLVRVEE